MATPTYLGTALLLALCAQPLLLHAARAAEPAAATQAPATAAQLRVDGLYYARDPQTSGHVFLRFHPDGQVLASAGLGSPVQALEWLKPDSERAGKGRYRVEGDKLDFETTLKGGRIHYTGTIVGTTLDLQVTTRATGKPSRRKYVFVPDATSTFGPTDPVAIDMQPAPYPKGAPNREATVKLLVDVSTAGAVTSASVENSSGVEALDAAALEAARKWTFRAARDERGRPVAATLRVPMTFTPPLNVRALLATSCSQVNEEVARLDPAAGASAGPTIDRALGLVNLRQTTPALGLLPDFADVPTLPEGSYLTFVRNFGRTVDGLKAQCAAQPEATFGDVLRAQLQTLGRR